MINIDTVLNRAHVYLENHIEESINYYTKEEPNKSMKEAYIRCEKELKPLQAFLFMNLSDVDKLSEKYRDFYNECLGRYKTDKVFAQCINVCLKKLRAKYKDERIRLKDDTIVEGKNHFDKVFEKLNERVEENVM